MPPNKTSKRPTRSKQPWEKMHAITRVRAGESKAAVARSIDVPESTLRGWCKNAEKIEATTRQPSSSPASGASTEFSEGREKRVKLDDIASPQNLIVRNSTPPGPSEINANYPGAIDLSRTSPQASTAGRVENGMMMNPQDLSKYYQAARFNQVFQVLQQAQDMSLRYDLAGNSGSSLLTTTTSPSVNGAAKLPNERIAPDESVRQWLNATSPSSQISPNSSSATLSTPMNGQQTTSPVAGKTPEQQAFYLEWCKAMSVMSGVGLGAPFNLPLATTSTHSIPMLYNQLIQNNSERSATVSQPATPRQPTSTRSVSNQPREEIEVPEMHCDDEAQKPGSPLSTVTLQDKNDKSLIVDLSPSASRRSRSTSGQSASTTDQSSNADQSTSTMNVSRKCEKHAIVETAPEVPAKKVKHASLENVVSDLKENVVVNGGEQDNKVGDIQECIATAESFLHALEKNSSHPSVTAFHLKQVKSIIASFTSAVEISSKRKRK